MPTTSWIDLDPGLPSLKRSAWAGLVLAAVWGFSGNPAWAYKVQKVCTDQPATAKEPARKTCKIVRVDPNKEPAPQEDKKEEKKHGGH